MGGHWDQWKDLFDKTNKFVDNIAAALGGDNHKTKILQELQATDDFIKVIKGNVKCKAFAKFITELNIQIKPCPQIPTPVGIKSTGQGIAAAVSGGGIPRSLRAGGMWAGESTVTTVSLSYNEEALKGIMTMIGKINTYVERLSFLQSGASQQTPGSERSSYLIQVHINGGGMDSTSIIQNS